jgi:hypothetical protein
MRAEAGDDTASLPNPTAESQTNEQVVRLGQLKNLQSHTSDLPAPRILRPRPHQISSVEAIAETTPKPKSETKAPVSKPATEKATDVKIASLPKPEMKVPVSKPTDVKPVEKTKNVKSPMPLMTSVQVVEATSIDSVTSSRVQPVIVPDQTPSILGAIGHQQLRDHAAQSIRGAQQRLDRGATFTAQKMAVDALRHIASSKDLVNGTNQYSLDLSAAMTAIRESRDFATAHGMADVSTMKRLVDSHQTTALKGVDLEAMSALKATEIYLTSANRILIESFGDVPLAADAMVLLGKVEKHIETTNPMHSGAVALTLHKAASEIAPSNSIVQRELGNTLMEQGLTKHAAEAFRRSVTLAPQRSSYQSLMEASRQVGDIQTAELCENILENSELPSDLPITQLSQDEFAKTYRPVSYRIDTPTAENAKPKAAEKSAGETKTAKKPWYSIFKK